MKIFRIIVFVFLSALLISPALFAQEDFQGSKDHPLLTRMPRYYIGHCAKNDFDKMSFEDSKGKPVEVEGRYTELNYRAKDDPSIVSPIKIGRNYQNAITKIGGKILFQNLNSGGGETTMKVTRGKEEIWVKVRIGDSGRNYQVFIIEKAAMAQEVTANADAWKSDINATGHAAVYGINFDTDKAVIKSGSEAVLKEIATLLKKNPSLNIRLVGHTDSVGDFAHNMTLSEARAKAVMAALTSQHGIAAARLSAHGVGPLTPVSSNDSEEGRSKNRRVEIVKK
ncbi:MAG: OmpA family protein [Spirochaetota bacterium]